LNRAARRQRALSEKKKAEAQSPPRVASPNQKRTKGEVFFGSIINMACGVFGVGALPLVFHWIIASTIDDANPHLQQDAYLLALVLWGNTFYEVRSTSEGRIAKMWLRLYSQGVHWVSIAFMAGMAYAYALIVAKPNTSSAHALENIWLVGVLLLIAAAAYLAFKVPILEAEAADKADKD
jgi:hypothetical protein